jgi:hypothetical protein
MSLWLHDLMKGPRTATSLEGSEQNMLKYRVWYTIDLAQCDFTKVVVYSFTDGILTSLKAYHNFL